MVLGPSKSYTVERFNIMARIKAENLPAWRKSSPFGLSDVPRETVHVEFDSKKYSTDVPEVRFGEDLQVAAGFFGGIPDLVNAAQAYVNMLLTNAAKAAVRETSPASFDDLVAKQLKAIISDWSALPKNAGKVPTDEQKAKMRAIAENRVRSNMERKALAEL